MKDKLREKAKGLLHLHFCEQEGLTSGQPSHDQWLKAVDELQDAISELESELKGEEPKQLCKDCRMFDDKWIAGFCHICQCQPDMTTEEILNKHFTNG